MEVPEAHTGPVVELLGKRRGLMLDMQGLGLVKCTFCLPGFHFRNLSLVNFPIGFHEIMGYTITMKKQRKVNGVFVIETQFIANFLVVQSRCCLLLRIVSEYILTTILSFYCLVIEFSTPSCICMHKQSNHMQNLDSCAYNMKEELCLVWINVSYWNDKNFT